VDYQDFLQSKRRTFVPTGIDVPTTYLNSKLFDFQKDIVRWALLKGKACIFLSTGLGKTAIQLEWASQVYKETRDKVLILAPLAVAAQTVAEGCKFGISVNYFRDASGIKPGINITNYEMLGKFDCSQFAGVVLDESSILKSYTSKTRGQIIESFQGTPFRLACTATPAPNDHMELGNHAEFVGVMTRTEMLSLFFVHDGGETSKWRLKKHAAEDFWKWMASWAVMLSKPSDVGYDTVGYELPPLNVHEVVVDDAGATARLAEMKAERRVKRVSLDEARQLRNISLTKRVEAAAKIVNDAPNRQWVVWCDLNDESAALAAAIPGAVEVVGADSPEFKEDAFNKFTAGEIRVLVTKPSIAGFGMNWQNCSSTVFVGLSYSFEAYYQAVRRFWRFGQTNPVDAFIVTSSAEAGVVEAIKVKEQKFGEMLSGMISATQEITKENIKQTHRASDPYSEDRASGKNWTMLLGDSCARMKEVPDDSVGFSVFSPPFASLYTYSNSERDLGNCNGDAEFFKHFDFIIKELHRITMPGRLVSVHCMLLPTSKERNGYIGIRDFRGDVIKAFQAAGFIFHSEVAIWKNPVIAMQRTKALGLLHKTIRKDSAMSRNGINDYLVTFRKPGENAEPISHTHETFPVSMWQQFASPVWADINPNNTLQFRSARDNNDERHICPLQLSVIERAIYLWSNPGDLVFSPFAGIGSEGWQAIHMGRRFLGVELKQSYFSAAANNLTTKEGELEATGPNLKCPVFNVFNGRETYGKPKDPEPVTQIDEMEEAEAA
jgi:DNA modification methylase